MVLRARLGTGPQGRLALYWPGTESNMSEPTKKNCWRESRNWRQSLRPGRRLP